MKVGKLEQLRSLLRSYDSCVVAYSGGVDSVFLAKLAHLELGSRMLAVISDSPSLPRRELAEAESIAREHGIPLRVIRTKEFDNPDYLSNPSNRCYFCKWALFDELGEVVRETGFRVVAYGENASDIGDFRPGAKAAVEFKVCAPLKEIGMTKEEIRTYSAQLGLVTADKPQMPCLSSRIPHGEQVTVDKLAMIEAGEAVLRDLGFREVRVRHSVTPSGHSAKVEVGQDELSRLNSPETWTAIDTSLRKIGYTETQWARTGYQRGNLSRPFVMSD
ncbi:MAG: ATP-dependent sacrificial sulfur transferase LarE [Pedosphaera sp.]|nr:ATP-dependent sacrificial sulfur transferase LarE [Pedosphaera sp.]